jgi:hypothetical protein
MLPYHPNPHGFWISREPPAQVPNPASGFTMAPPAHLDHQIQHYDHFFPGHGNQFNSETLEAVLMRPRPPAPPPAEMPPANEARTGAVQAAGAGHARARKRPFRTDRHSKIRTAQGVRDRRMRLSLDVARDFFALQDQLGFDKASKTVDWLLTQSKPAIDRLSESSRLNAARAGEDGMSSLSSAEREGRRLKETELAAGSGKGAVDVEKAMRARGGGTSVLMEHRREMNGGLMSASMTGGEYYYDLGEMMCINGGECDDDDEYDEDGDFLDGMQY